MNSLPKSPAGTPPRQSVLIVDESADSIDVLSTLLRRRGIETLSTNTAAHGLELAWQHHPDLIVLDMEAVPLNGPAICEGFDAAARHGDAQIVLLAQAQTPQSDSNTTHVFSKPYHYAPLIRKIEELLTPSS